jgi:tetratricopeptide (TPR) repeat protein
MQIKKILALISVPATFTQMQRHCFCLEATSSSGIEIEILKNKLDSSLTWLNVIMTSGSFLLSVVGILLALIGFINLTKAHKIVDKRIKGKLEELKLHFADEFSKVQEATQKMIAGYTCQTQGDVDRAIELYTSAVKIFPQVFNGYTSLGYAYHQKQNYPSALLAFNKAAELFPKRIESYNDLARIYALLNNKAECVKNIKKMAAIDVNSKGFIINDNTLTSLLTMIEIDDLYS